MDPVRISRQEGTRAMRTQPDTMVKEYDGAESTTIAAELGQDIMTRGYPWHVKVRANPHCMGNDQAAYLDPATARALARHLDALADEAERRTDQDEDDRAAYACTACHKPVFKSGSAWLHMDGGAVITAMADTFNV
jgi:hypothetical protein